MAPAGMSLDRARSAAANNAAWCDAVCRAAGGATALTGGWWRNAAASPAWFPNLVTLDPAVEAAAVASALREVAAGGAPVGVKDSFGTLDLAPIGFTKLFDARWIWRDAVAPAVASRQLAWTRIESVADLRAWEAAWRPGPEAAALAPAIFGPALLRIDQVAFLAGHEGTQLLAGAALTETDQVVGLACAFHRGTDPDPLRRELVSVVQARYPGRAIVGYESGDELRAMRALGFGEVGPLAVWTGALPR